jgi:DNA-binding MarR family transcriptional regulator
MATKASSTTMVGYNNTTMVVDLSLSSLFAGWAMADEIQRRLAADGFGDLRFSDGFVFQHLVEGPATIGVLAERLEVTQQAASKSVADLERRGYVARAPDPADARARLVALTERGRGAIEGARRHRAALGAELGEKLGPRRVEAAGRLLDDVVAELGAEAAVRGRRVRAPR